MKLIFADEFKKFAKSSPGWDVRWQPKAMKPRKGDKTLGK